MTNSADPDQFASEEANWSGSTLFAWAGQKNNPALNLGHFVSASVKRKVTEELGKEGKDRNSKG